jgi:hypothetical protein
MVFMHLTGILTPEIGATIKSIYTDLIVMFWGGDNLIPAGIVCRGKQSAQRPPKAVV